MPVDVDRRHGERAGVEVGRRLHALLAGAFALALLTRLQALVVVPAFLLALGLLALAERSTDPDEHDRWLGILRAATAPVVPTPQPDPSTAIVQ